MLWNLRKISHKVPRDAEFQKRSARALLYVTTHIELHQLRRFCGTTGRSSLVDISICYKSKSTWYCRDRASSCNIYAVQQDTQSVAMSKFIQHLCSSTCFEPHWSIFRSVFYKLCVQIWYVVTRVLLDTSSRYEVVGRTEVLTDVKYAVNIDFQLSDMRHI